MQNWNHQPTLTGRMAGMLEGYRIYRLLFFLAIPVPVAVVSFPPLARGLGYPGIASWVLCSQATLLALFIGFMCDWAWINLADAREARKERRRRDEYNHMIQMARWARDRGYPKAVPYQYKESQGGAPQGGVTNGQKAHQWARGLWQHTYHHKVKLRNMETMMGQTAIREIEPEQPNLRGVK